MPGYAQRIAVVPGLRTGTARTRTTMSASKLATRRAPHRRTCALAPRGSGPQRTGILSAPAATFESAAAICSTWALSPSRAWWGNVRHSRRALAAPTRADVAAAKRSRSSVDHITCLAVNGL